MQKYCVQNIKDILENSEVIVVDEILLEIMKKDLENFNGDVILLS